MPTYRNDSSNTYWVENTSGAQALVEPGASVETYKYYPGLALMTKTADTPYYPLCLQKDAPVVSGAGDMPAILIDAAAGKIEIINLSDATLTVYLQSKENADTLIIPPDYVRVLDDIKDRFTQIVLNASAAVTAGQVYVHQLIG